MSARPSRVTRALYLLDAGLLAFNLGMELRDRVRRARDAREHALQVRAKRSGELGAKLAASSAELDGITARMDRLAATLRENAQRDEERRRRLSESRKVCDRVHEDSSTSAAGNPEGKARRDSATAPGAPTSRCCAEGCCGGAR